MNRPGVEPLDEAAAYALAAWQRFDREVDDAVLRAVCAAFALVAMADGNLDRRESQRFLGLLRQRFREIPKLDFSRTEAHFQALAEALLSDPEAGRRRALGELSALRGQSEPAELVRSAARLALIADSRIDPTETELYAEICEALGLPR